MPVRSSVLSYFRTTNMVVIECEKSSNMIDNGTKSEVFASDDPRGTALVKDFNLYVVR